MGTDFNNDKELYLEIKPPPLHYPKEIKWPWYTATLRTVRKEHTCKQCQQPINIGDRAYTVVLWNSGMVGKIFPSYVHPVCFHSFMEATIK